MNQERLLRMGAVAGIIFLMLLGFAWIALAHDATQNQLSWLQGFVALASFLGAAASFGTLLLAMLIAAALVGGVAYVANTDSAAILLPSTA